MRQAPKLTLVTPPGAEPVSAADIAGWTGAAATDPVVVALATSARQACESHLGIALITQEWHQFYDLVHAPDSWWDGVREAPVSEVLRVPQSFPLARFPLQSVEGVSFFADDDSESVVSASVYYVSATSRPPYVTLRSGFQWPTPVYRVRDAVRVHMRVGFGAAASDVPQVIKDGIKALAGYMYEHRGACEVEDAIKKSGASDFWKQYRVMKT